jgi:1-acyl-sn-glycerol-3-phosphate acyltransferase
MDWTVIGDVGNNIEKNIFAVMPHTSNWDFAIGVLVKFGYNMRLNYLAKSQLFFPPLSWIMRGTGGVPVERSRAHNLVTQIAKIFDAKNRFALAITPEGTRSKVSKLKKGFYYIAKEANVPIIFVAFDFKSRAVVFREPFYVTGDYARDMKTIIPFYHNVTGKRDENNSIRKLNFKNSKTT